MDERPNKYKKAVDPDDWHRFKREHPDQYRIIKAYAVKTFPFVTIDYQGVTYTNLLIPRLQFDIGGMFGFLSKHHHLRKYEHIDYQELPHYKDGTYLTIRIDHEAVPMSFLCDYMWLEVRRLLAYHKNLLLFPHERS